MTRRKKISRRRIQAIIGLLDLIEAELPSEPITTITEGEAGDDEDEADDEQEELYESRGLAAAADDIEVKIDLAILGFQKSGVLPEIDGGTYSLSAVFETVFGEESSLADLSVDLETILSGYNDVIQHEDVESALVLISQMRDHIERMGKDATPTK